MDPRQAYIALNLLPNIGPVKVQRLLERFETPSAILSANAKQLTEVHGIGRDSAEALSNWKQTIDLDGELKKIDRHGLQVLTPLDDSYPAPLKQIYDPPLVLYVWGELKPTDVHAIAIVGSRRCTHYGNQTARKLGFQLAHSGTCVISGLARGIDTAAHEGALASGGRTVAVIGSGMNQLYPPENQALAERIATQGAVISEFPIDMPPAKRTFPMRNRIVAGWSKGVVVVEAPVKSGALITANLASEQNRDVYAVPGQIDRPTSGGCHRLIQDGAKLVTCAEDILEDLDSLFSLPTPSGSAEVPAEPPSRGHQLAGSEKKLYLAMGDEEWHIDRIAETVKMGISEVSATLLKLEMKRLVKQLPGKYFVKLV